MESVSPSPASPAKNDRKTELRETIKTLIIAVVFALIFRSFAYEPFHIPSDSMKSNLLVGDYLFTSKFAYGYSRFSLPFLLKMLPIKGRIFEHPPQRGDIVVFHPPGASLLSDPFIKRIIGLPGDRIQMKGGVLFINDKPMLKAYVDEWTDPRPDGVAGFPRTYLRYRETLPEGKSYYILNREGFGNAEDTRLFTVPEGHYFMMGDNRDNSHDSRFQDGPHPLVGYVPEENFIGRADIIVFSWESLFSFRLDRFFTRIP